MKQQSSNGPKHMLRRAQSMADASGKPTYVVYDLSDKSYHAQTERGDEAWERLIAIIEPKKGDNMGQHTQADLIRYMEGLTDCLIYPELGGCIFIETVSDDGSKVLERIVRLGPRPISSGCSKHNHVFANYPDGEMVDRIINILAERGLLLSIPQGESAALYNYTHKYGVYANESC